MNMTDSPEMSEALRAALAPIRDSFIASVPDRIVEINGCLSALTAGEDPIKTLSNLRTEVHKIAGIAGSIGFQNLGQTSAKADSALRALIDGEIDAPSVQQILNRIDTILSELSTIQAQGGT